MHFLGLGFDLLKNVLIFHLRKKHIFISVSSSSASLPMWNTNRRLRRHSIYIKAYFMPLGFKGKNNHGQNHFEIIFQGNTWTCLYMPAQKLGEHCPLLWCKKPSWGHGTAVIPLTSRPLESFTCHDLWPLANHNPDCLFRLIFTTYNKRPLPLWNS